MALPASVPDEPITTQPAYSEPPVIDLHGLSVSFGRRQILKNLRGDLRGKAIGLLGPNGAGKTTLIHTLLGFHPPSAGTARIFGLDIVDQAKEIKSLIGYMPERDSFIAKMSAVHFVRLMGELAGLPSDADPDEIHGGTIEKPWLAAVEAFAIGGGCQYLLTMDYVIGASDAYMTLPARKEGIIPGAANMRMPRFTGDRIARQAIMSGRQLDCDSPEGRLICDEVVPPAEMDATLDRVIATFTESG